MSIRTTLHVALLPVAFATALAAQSTGTLELKGFGQATEMNGALNATHGVGGGPGLGIFLSPRWEIDFDAAWQDVNPRWWGYNAETVRLLKNITIAPHDRFLIGAGPGIANAGGSSNFILGGLVGWRHAFTPIIQSRIDGILQYNTNPAGGLKDFSSSGKNPITYRTDAAIRAGLSLMLDWPHHTPAPAPMPAAAPTPAPAPAPAPVVTQPAPTPAPPPAPAPTPAPQPETRPAPVPVPAPPRVNTDSINRANAAAATLREPVRFAFDKSVLRSEDTKALDAKVPILKANPGVHIRIEGNADERGSDEYNMAIGQRRAAAAKAYLVAHGIDAARIETLSYGKSRPANPEHTEAAWAENRRDEFVITVGGDRLIGP